MADLQLFEGSLQLLLLDPEAVVSCLLVSLHSTPHGALAFHYKRMHGETCMRKKRRKKQTIQVSLIVTVASMQGTHCHTHASCQVSIPACYDV